MIPISPVSVTVPNEVLGLPDPPPPPAPPPGMQPPPNAQPVDDDDTPDIQPVKPKPAPKPAAKRK